MGRVTKFEREEKGENQTDVDPFLEHCLPSNREAEQSILGAILLENTVCNQAVELLKRDDFFLDSHRKIFDKMLALNERGSPIDLVTLTDELRKVGEFEQVGGATYIASLIDGVPRTDTIEPYAKIVKEKAFFRRLITTANQIINRCAEGEDSPEQIAMDVQDRLDIEVADYLGNEIAQARPRLMTILDLESLKPTLWIVPGHIPERGFVLLYGASGGYKSFYALDVAAKIARTRTVVYVAAEGQGGYAKRVRAWVKHHGDKPRGLFFWLESVNMLDPRAVSRLIEAVRSVNPDVIIFDTLSRCMAGGEENSSQDMSTFVDSVSRIQRSLSTAVLVVHHKGKSNQSERGHTALRGAADVMIEITNDDGTIIVRCEKQKDEEAFDSYCLRPIRVELSESEDSLVLLPARQVADEFAPLSAHQRKLLEVLNLSTFTQTGARYNQLKVESGVPEGSIYRALHHLKNKVMITQADKGEPYFITDVGKWVVESSPDKTPVSLYGESENLPEPSSYQTSHQRDDDNSSVLADHQPSSSPPLLGGDDVMADGKQTAGVSGKGNSVWSR